QPFGAVVLFAHPELTAGIAAPEGDADRLFAARAAIEAESVDRPHDLDLQPGFLAYLAMDCLLGCLAGVDAAGACLPFTWGVILRRAAPQYRDRAVLFDHIGDGDDELGRHAGLSQPSPAPTTSRCRARRSRCADGRGP